MPIKRTINKRKAHYNLAQYSRRPSSPFNPSYTTQSHYNLAQCTKSPSKSRELCYGLLMTPKSGCLIIILSAKLN